MMKRFLYAVLTALFLVTLPASAGLPWSHRKLVIIHFNDTHSHFEPVKVSESENMGGVIERAAFVDSVRRADGKKNVLLLHAGDFSQGSSYFTILHGDLEVNVINAMKYDVITLGNHEFDNGIEELGRRMKNVKCPVVCANYDFSPFELGKYVKPYAIIHKAGMKIGVIGILTDVSSVIDRDIADRMPYLDPAETVNRYAKYLKEEEHCDLVICLTHIGYVGSDLTDPELAAQTRNVDLIVGGHSHTFLKKMEYTSNLDGVQVPIVTDGCWGVYAGEVIVEKK